MAIPKYPMAWPFLHVEDWNDNGDQDVVFHYGLVMCLVERLFIECGYVQGKILQVKRRE
mgnify:CR=1 FL=1